MNNKKFYIDINTGKLNKKKINMIGGAQPTYKDIVEYLRFNTEIEEKYIIDEDANPKIILTPQQINNNLEYDKLETLARNIYNNPNLTNSNDLKKIINDPIKNKINETIKKYINQYKEKEPNFYNPLYTGMQGNYYINTNSFENLKIGSTSSTYSPNSTKSIYGDLVSIVYLFNYYKNEIFVNEANDIYNFFNKIDNNLFEIRTNLTDKEDKQKFIEFKKNRLKIFFNMKFNKEFYKDIEKNDTIKDIITKIIIINTNETNNIDIYEEKYYDKILEISKLPQNAQDDIVTKYKNYNKIIDYLKNYSENLDINKTIYEIKNNKFKLDAYNFINKLIISKYNEKNKTIYNQLLELINTESDFLKNTHIFSEINKQLKYSTWIINSVQNLFNTANIRNDINKLIQQLNESNKFYFFIKDLQVSDNQFEKLVDIYITINKYKTEKDTDKDRTKYYDNISKFFITYQIVTDKKEIYKLLNSIDIQDNNSNNSIIQLKQYINNMAFLYKNNNTDFNNITVSDTNLIEKLKEFTRNINNDKLFNINDMCQIINKYLESFTTLSKITINKENFLLNSFYTSFNQPLQQLLDASSSPKEKFIILYNLAQNNILINMTDVDFYNLLDLYINAFKKPTDKIDIQDIKNIIKKTDINNTNINQYIDYNKSFNKKFNYNNNLLVNLINFISEHTSKLNPLQKIDEMKKTNPLIYNDINFEDIFTDQLIDINSFFKEKMYNNICITNKLKDKKKIEGIKLLLDIFECYDNLTNNNNLDDEFNRIYLYISKNTKESNSKYLIKEKKLYSILTKLRLGECDSEIKDIKNMINKKKHIPTDINDLLNIGNLSSTDNYKQIYLYNLLLSYSPSNIDLDPNKIVFDYFTSKKENITQNINTKTLTGTIKTIFNIREIVKGITDFTNISLTDFDKFIDTKLKSHYGNDWKIYLYFNFDHKIIDINKLNKIIQILKSTNNQIILDNYKDDDNNDNNDNLIEIFKKVIEYNIIQLEKIDKKNNLLELFMKNKWIKLENSKTNNDYPNKLLLKNLYDILVESANQSYLTLNGLEYIKNKFIDNTDINNNSYDNIINKLVIFSNDPNIYISQINYETKYNALKIIIEKIENGEANRLEIEEMINFTETCNEFVKNNQGYKLFINTYDKSKELEYDEQYKLYDILHEICKTDSFQSTIQSNIIQVGKEQIVTSITNYAKEKMIDLGINVNNLTNIVSTATTAAKYVATFAAGAYALSLGYKIVNNLLGKSSSLGLQPSASGNKDTEKQLKLSKQFQEDEEFIINELVRVYDDKQQVSSKVLSFIKQKYIKFQIEMNDLPDPDVDSKILDKIINKYINKINNRDDDKHTIIIDMLNNIYEDISKLLGFDNNIPINEQTRSFKDVYSHLKDNFDYDPDNIFKGIEINEYPDQVKIVERLKRKYNNFMKVTQNQSFNLKKKDKTKIKKMIAEIINLEINIFKGSNQYTFVNALKHFLNE